MKGLSNYSTTQKYVRWESLLPRMRTSSPETRLSFLKMKVSRDERDVKLQLLSCFVTFFVWMVTASWPPGHHQTKHWVVNLVWCVFHNNDTWSYLCNIKYFVRQTCKQNCLKALKIKLKQTHIQNQQHYTQRNFDNVGVLFAILADYFQNVA